MWRAASPSFLQLAGTKPLIEFLRGAGRGSPPVGFNCLAQALRHRHRFLGLQRHHRRDHSRAQPFDIVAVTDDGDRQRGAADILDQQSQVDHFADPARNLEIAFDMNERKSVPAAGYQLGIIVTELLPIPIFDQTVEHVEVMREVDDAGWIAMRKTNRNVACKRPARRHKSILTHGMALSCFATAQAADMSTSKLRSVISLKKSRACPSQICETQFDPNQSLAARKVFMLASEGVME